MCKLVFVDIMKVNDEASLERCSGLCLEKLFKRIEKKIRNYRADGYEFQLSYTLEEKGLLGIEYEYKTTIEDGGSLADIFGGSPEITINRFKEKFLDDMEILFDTYKYKRRNMTRCIITMTNSIGSRVQFEHWFDAVLSYAYYMYYKKKQKNFAQYMDVVHEVWEGISNWNDSNYLPEIWVPKKPTGKRKKRIGDML